MGEVTSYTPTRTETRLISTQKTETRPVYEQVTRIGPDGQPTTYTQQVGTSQQKSTETYPSEYTINAQVGIIAKLVDVETAEIVWIGSYSDDDSSALRAADYIAQQLVKSFAKELSKR